jgi:hypothetical protein
VIVWLDGLGEWKPLVGAGLVLLVGADLLRAALRGRRPVIAPLLFLP